ncbi:hypothetical protein GCM10012320_26490 [Sinomonas cellulolyticus]|uniref:Uncharacterized protein n=1 Tax=Sinomonas cellulolyticus TaxID=2801916 RepID=A0ABS1K657_9MICC|nr:MULTISPECIES: hypothetical protein [Sinomonas]MBL0707131.1 hypothetical protein [Sinomonas cellulolyticus]GHG54885.1 hypothetical protein GCM10012320_26490 [Sinomonas sp. KCTC 49339]
MINVLDLAPGTRIELVDGRRATVEENMGDGQWVEALEDGAETSELTHSQDIARILHD